MSEPEAGWHAEAAEEFNRHEGRGDGARLVGSLAGGLTLLRDALYSRVHDDVERIVGKDSMLLPVSDKKTQRRVKTEIELYQIAESAAAVREGRYLRAADAWYAQWLTRLRLADAALDPSTGGRVDQYLAESADRRRLAFTDVLARALAESGQAPLVLFRLVPPAVGIVTAVAFRDHRRAEDLRTRQQTCLPAIADCPDCRARVLDNAEQCPGCGNPLWHYRWLTAAD